MIEPDSSASASRKAPRTPAQCMVARGITISTAKTTLGNVVVLNISELYVCIQIQSKVLLQAPCMCASGERRWRAPKLFLLPADPADHFSQSCGTGRQTPSNARPTERPQRSLHCLYIFIGFRSWYSWRTEDRIGPEAVLLRLWDRLAPAAGVRCTAVAPWRRVRPWAMLHRRCWIGQSGQALRTMSAWPLPWSRPCSGLASRGGQPWPPFWR